MKIFINNVNTYSGNCLCQTFDEIDNKKTEIYGTLVETKKAVGDDDDDDDNDESTIRYYFENVKKIISKTPNDNIVKHILKCHLVIYDINNTNLEELEYVIHKLKYEKIKNKITIILISSIMVWNKTKRKFVQLRKEKKLPIENHQKNVNDNGKQEIVKNGNPENVSSDKEKEEEKEEEAKKRKKKKESKEEEQNEKKNRRDKTEKKQDEEENQKNTIFLQAPEIFKTDKYLQRTCSNSYEPYKNIETLILSLNSNKNITAYVVASGIPYGNGEDTFFPIFKNAWLGKNNYIIEKGNNYIPIIHIKGLCEYIKNLYFSNSPKKYFIAVDNEFVTQKEIVETVAHHMSDSESFIHVSLQNSLTFENTEPLCVNLRFQCTPLFDDKEKIKGKGKKQSKRAKKKKKNDSGDDNSEEEQKDKDTDTDTDTDSESESETDDDKDDTSDSNDSERKEKKSGDDEEVNGDDTQSDDSSESDSDKRGSEESEEADTKDDKTSIKKKEDNKKRTTKKILAPTFYCSTGFRKNIEIVAKEFCDQRNLKRLKILILGQPGSGKTFVAKKLCEHYNLKLCSINLMIEECKKKNYNFPDYFKKYLESSDNSVKQMKGKGKDKVSGKNKDKEKNKEKEKEKERGKLKLDDLSSMFYKILEGNGHKFRGFILDYFPRSYEEAKFFFEEFFAKELNNKREQKQKMSLNKNKKKKNDDSGSSSDGENKHDDEDSEEKEKGQKKRRKKSEEESDSVESDERENGSTEVEDEEEEEEEEENDVSLDEEENEEDVDDNIKKSKIKKSKKKEKKKKKIINTFLLPEYVIILKATEEICRKRMMELNEDQIIKDHNDEAGFERRYNKYIKENYQEDYFEGTEKKTVEDYFIENEVEIFSVHINENTLTEDILTNIRIFIENKKFYNFLAPESEKIKRELEEREDMLRKEKEIKRKIDEEIVRQEMLENEKLLNEEKQRQLLLLEHQQKYIQNQSLPLRFYLIKNILPILSDSLIYVCKTKPKNPCLHIAEFLLKNAHKYDVDKNDIQDA